MTDELVKRLRGWRGFHQANLSIEAADRIEALTADHNATLARLADAVAREINLTAERDRLGRELNVAKYGVPDFAWSMHKIAMADLEADNTRLREALWAILACETPNANATVTRMASITKAALKGETP